MCEACDAMESLGDAIHTDDFEAAAVALGALLGVVISGACLVRGEAYAGTVMQEFCSRYATTLSEAGEEAEAAMRELRPPLPRLH